MLFFHALALQHTADHLGIKTEELCPYPGRGFISDTSKGWCAVVKVTYSPFFTRHIFSVNHPWRWQSFSCGSSSKSGYGSKRCQSPLIPATASLAGSLKFHFLKWKLSDSLLVCA